MYGQFIVIFALLITGFVMRKKKIIDGNMNVSLNKMLLYVAIPCLIIHKIGNIVMEGDLLRDFLLAFAIFYAVQLVFSVYTYGYTKARKFPKGRGVVAELCMTAPNSGFMGFPIALIFFGELGLVLMIAANMAMNLYLFTYGIVRMEMSRESEKMKLGSLLREVGKNLVNPITISILVGFAVCLAQITIPAPVNEFLLLIANLCTPLSMIYIGSALCEQDIVGLLKDRMVLETGVNKLIMFPIFVLAAVYFLPIDPLVKAICVLPASMPTAAVTPILAGEKGHDEVFGGETVVTSTAFSAITIFIFVQVINALLV